ncbi:putative Xaa-pro dipeptidyl-peptidase [Streptomyces afghaniensis 772]|uniref:Putative Xaa-pro dipeptidyl-peptidase n=1 Tax=Streptomyces afghaniensis 772 TaxID=1283301 RepID=S4M7Z2_9ACTN|nr:putative Xaa-pro dipeptidyl-peptidase [Streptomyces afghaniensis 772]
MPKRTRFTTWRPLATAATAALMATLLTPAAADAARQPAPRESRPVHSYENAVREAVWVDTGLDGDRDGKADRVAVDIVRPREPALQGRKVPVIMDASPYYSCCGRGNESQKKTYDANGDVTRMPLYYDNYFVPRGYAFVGVDLAGTNRSDGCVDVGGRSDIQSAKAVVDWLNGRAKAYTTRTGTTRAKAAWTNGRTGMIGKSWDGTIANGVAATGVEGLKTIVPISAISSWYTTTSSRAPRSTTPAPNGCPTTSTAPTPGPSAPPCSRSSSTGPRARATGPRCGPSAITSGPRGRSRPASSSCTACRTSTCG